MKRNRVKKLLAFAVVLFAGLSFAVSSYAQADKTQQKISLMVAAVQARDSGDLVTSKKSLEELLKIAPKDKAVQQLLMDVNAAIEAQNKAVAEAKAKEAAAKAAEAKKVAEAKKAAEVKKAADAKAAAEAKKVADAKAAKDAKIAAEKAAVDQALAAAEHKQKLTVDKVYELIDESYTLIDDEKLADAAQKISTADAKLAECDSATDLVKNAKKEIKAVKAALAKENAKAAAAKGDFASAKQYAQDYAEKSDNSSDSKRLADKIARDDENPYKNTLESVSPEYVERQKEVKNLIKRGKIQYLYGDYDGAAITFRSVGTLDSNNIESLAYLKLISEKLNKVGRKTVESTRASMLNDVNEAWRLPQVYSGTLATNEKGVVASPVAAKLKEIVIPEANFQEVPLAKVVSTLSTLSVEYDKSTDGEKGVNMVLYGAEGSNAKNVSMVLRGATLGQILDFATRQVAYTYDIEDDVVVVRKGAENQPTLQTDTVSFPLSQATVTRMLGISGTKAEGEGGNDPFASNAAASADGGDKKDDMIKQFLTKAGVEFGPASGLVFDGTTIIVTNTPRNLDKIRNILQRYSEVKQVEVETKFMEVNQGNLDQLAFNYNMSRVRADGRTETLFQTYNTEMGKSLDYSNNRLLSMTKSQTNAGSVPTTIINTDPTLSAPTKDQVAQNIPDVPSSINLAKNAMSTADTILGVINGFEARMAITAISQEQGSDLLCAPKVTVLSGETAQIRISQELRYPEQWGDVQSNVGQSSGTSTSGGAAGVTITPGTPQDFVKYDVGVVMEVTPTVEEDSSITLLLNPTVSEFEGFMEYGGVAVALSGYVTVTVPSGFIQPVFSVREVRTKVTVFDGATVVLGGLTREEVKTVNDKVPVLGDIPLLGRLFKSKGETRQKRNLLIFVTANRISPGGSIANEQFSAMRPGSLYQSPIVVSPGGAIKRIRAVEKEAAATK